MIHTPDNASEDFLVAGLSYCLLWELWGDASEDDFAEHKERVERRCELTERDHWRLELYEESSPTAQEERSLLDRLQRYRRYAGNGVSIADSIVALLPPQLQERAARHSLLRRIDPPSPGWFARLFRRRGTAPRADPAPLADREADFERFLNLPGAVEGFRRFWRRPPKNRDNRQTRVLVILGMALGQSIDLETESKRHRWLERLERACHFSEQTRDDLLEVAAMTNEASYNAEELAYCIMIDARNRDQANFVAFLETYESALYAFGAELERTLKTVGATA